MSEVDKALQKLLEERKVQGLAHWLFGVELTDGQAEIVKSIIYPEYDRVVISACTRYGKTFSTAVGVGLYIYLNEDKKIHLLAPTNDQAKIIRNEIADLIVKSPQLQDLVDDATKGSKRLKKEVSKKRITFKNGCEVSTISAQGKAKRVMGKGGHLNIVDESCLISEEVFNKRIFRMLGDGPDSKLIELSNPWHKDNQFFKHWTSDRYKQIHIGYEQALEEGRITEDFLTEARETLTDTEFTVLYKSEFPEDTADTLIKWKDIKRALDNNFDLEPENTFYGVDVARKGNDLTVLTKVVNEADKWKVKGIHYWKHKDTMATVGRIIEAVEDKDQEIRVDEIGVGGGVVDRLDEQNYNVRGVKTNKTPERDKHRFRDRKAEQYFELKGLFEENNIDLQDDETLKRELNKLNYEFTSRGKIKINDPSKSPDFADSLSLATIPNREDAYYGILE